MGYSVQKKDPHEFTAGGGGPLLFKHRKRNYQRRLHGEAQSCPSRLYEKRLKDTPSKTRSHTGSGEKKKSEEWVEERNAISWEGGESVLLRRDHRTA